ncbi:uncharacterized protein LOC131954291, partial [Physella acuta]|uniref:uncharacterized protein LOC131954291 n=1 Tax=Physella acuta TaxID=109671 RepID=UPI0027DC641E
MEKFWCLTVLMLIGCGACRADDNVADAPAISYNLMTFYTLFNGQFSDQVEVASYQSSDASDPDKPFLSVIKSTPVEIPALGQAVTYLYDQYFNGMLRRRVVCVIWEDSNGQIFIQPYNITSPPND